MSQMRLGHHKITIKPNTLASKIYKATHTLERHRHRFQVNPKCMANLQFITSGKSQGIMEIMELPNHKFYLATQFHPEFQSRPFEPCPIFKGFVQASLQK